MNSAEKPIYEKSQILLSNQELRLVNACLCVFLCVSPPCRAQALKLCFHNKLSCIPC